MAVSLRYYELIDSATFIIVVDFTSYIVRENIYKDGTRELWTSKGPWISECHATQNELKHDIMVNSPMNAISLADL